MTIQRVFFLLLATTLTVSVTGCDLTGSEDDGGSTVATTGAYIGNQGNFGDGNGSLSFFDPETRRVESSAITGLNSIVQGIAVRDTSLYVMANSAGRIDVYSSEDLSQTGQLTGLNGPRYLTFAGPSMAYVTDQQPFTSPDPDSIRVLNLSGRQPQLEESIAVPGTAEGITTAGDHVYAALGAFGESSLVADVNVNQSSLTQTIDVGCASRYLVADQSSDVFVLCSNKAEAVILEGNSGTIQGRLSLPDTAETAFGVGQSAFFSSAARELYVATDTEILRINTVSEEVSASFDVDDAASIGAVGYDSVEGELYVAREKGFTEQGTVTIRARNGDVETTFQAGIAPTYIDFQRVQR
jgi:hypothetical protein